MEEGYVGHCCKNGYLIDYYKLIVALRAATENPAGCASLSPLVVSQFIRCRGDLRSAEPGCSVKPETDTHGSDGKPTAGLSNNSMLGQNISCLLFVFMDYIINNNIVIYYKAVYSLTSSLPGKCFVLKATLALPVV